MRCCFMGPPGVGKGTQASFIAQKYGLKHISTGNLLREAVRKNSRLGVKVKGFLDGGKLVPDPLMIDLIHEELRGLKGFILDGFPRTLAQAEALDNLLKKKEMALDIVVVFVLSDEELVRRAAGRRIAPKSGRVYHVLFSPPKKEGFCDETGEELLQREDDKEDVVRERLKVYGKEPLAKYYEDQGLVKKLSAQGSPEQVRDRLEELFKTG